MKKVLLLFSFASFILAGCGSTGDDTPEPSSTTLNKELLYDKWWYNESNTIAHYFNSDGRYADVVGTWEWVNGSDTIKIHEKLQNKDFIWVINKGNTADKMETKLATGTSWGEFRTSW